MTFRISDHNHYRNPFFPLNSLIYLVRIDQTLKSDIYIGE